MRVKVGFKHKNCIKKEKKIDLFGDVVKNAYFCRKRSWIKTLLLMMYIANPIYDVVFKFMMEDDRVAKVMLGTLLRTEVLEVEMKQHEYTNALQDKIQLYRLDFAATVRDNDGNVRTILIELQKTWLGTETSRFRRYLGKMYQTMNTKENGKKGVNDTNGVFPPPIVTIYILGHELGDIEEPAIYVRRKYYDYEQNELQCSPDPFIESLTHDSIIVQVPYLKGRMRNKVERIMSVFDQALVTPQDKHLLLIDERTYQDDPEMESVLHRLLMASSKPEVREQMSVEDELLSEIEDRDTALMRQASKIAQQEDKISQQESMISQQESTISQQKNLIATSVRLMIKQGMDIHTVAKALNISEQEIAELVN